MNADQLRRAQPTVESSSETRRVVAALWSEALQMSELPCDTDNFFALGGDSMTMTMLEFRIKEEMSIELPAGTLLGAQSLGEFTALVDAAAQSQSANMKPECQPPVSI